MKDPTRRFSARAGAYARARPGYPSPLYDWLFSWLARDAVVADLGSGTGLFCRPLLERGHTLYAVEPNPDMRTMAEAALADFDGLVSVDGSAERTTLDEQTIDLATCAQAFHWFDFDAVRAELSRILRPAGSALVVWNTRRLDGGVFDRAYERFLNRWGTDYDRVSQTYLVRERLGGLFTDGTIERRVFSNHQDLDLPGLVARIESCSYIPGPEHADYPAMRAAIDELFAAQQHGGVVRLDYETEAYRCCKATPASRIGP